MGSAQYTISVDGVPFTGLGLHPGMATTWSLPSVAGPALAADMLLTGRVVLGHEAVGLGLASAAAPARASGTARIPPRGK